MAKKEIAGFIKLQIPAGGADPSPPVGPALGQNGLNIMDFCKQFNDKTKKMEKGMPIPVVITAYSDRSFTFVVKQPPNSYWIKKALNLKSGAKTTGTEVVGEISRKQLAEIAKDKMVDMNANDIEGAVQMLAGSARSMGIKVVG